MNEEDYDILQNIRQNSNDYILNASISQISAFQNFMMLMISIFTESPLM